MKQKPHTINGLWTSESVTEGHPDKICDQISDAVLDQCLKQDKNSRVACETAIFPNTVIVFGEITTNANIDIEHIVRNTLKDIGYTNSNIGIDAESCDVKINIQEQVAEIASGVNQSLEKRSKQTKHRFDAQGAGDQGMMFGFACKETDTLMPLPLALSHELTRTLSHLRHTKQIDWLRPDGKAQVTVEYRNGKPVQVTSVVVSAQHTPKVRQNKIKKTLLEQLIQNVIPQHLLSENTSYYINPSGSFVVGGPAADSGLTGRKIIMDTYGGRARHGGGAFSGKDPSKVDRSAAYAMRWIAKNIVNAGFATQAEVQISYAIGKAHPTSLHIETYGTNTIPEQNIQTMVEQNFDLRPLAIIEKLNLLQPIYQQTAAYGHFGQQHLNLPWEQTNRL